MNNRLVTSHLVILISLIIICIWDRIINIPWFPKNFCYVTQLNLYLQIYYFGSTLYYDIHSNDSLKHNQKFYNYIFSIAVLVFTMFWIMFISNRETLYKKGVSIPFSLNFCLHFVVPVFCFLEQLVINKRKNPKYVNIIAYLITLLVYGTILIIIYYIWKIRVYPYISLGILVTLAVKIGGFLFSLIGHYIYVWLSTDKTNKKENLEDEELVTYHTLRDGDENNN